MTVYFQKTVFYIDKLKQNHCQAFISIYQIKKLKSSHFAMKLGLGIIKVDERNMKYKYVFYISAVE